MMNIFLRSSSALALLSAALVASAAPYKYTITGLGSGTLNGTAFGFSASTDPVRVTLTGYGDTSTFDLRTPNPLVPGIPSVRLGNVSISVAGLPVDFLNETMLVSRVVGSNMVSITDDFVLVAGVTSTNFANYGLVSEINSDGTGTGSFSNGIPTLGGRFALTNLFAANFSAVAQPTPEPATFAALGLGAFAMLRRRKRA